MDRKKFGKILKATKKKHPRFDNERAMEYAWRKYKKSK